MGSEIQRFYSEGRLVADDRGELIKCDDVRKEVYATINRFQDLVSWQPGESRNALVCEIRDKVDALIAAAPKEPKDK
jgi:hypothetical protein